MNVYWPGTEPSDYVPPKPNTASSGLRSTSEYGMRTNPGTGAYTLHAGIDLIGVKDGINHSAVDGTVSRAEWYGGYGNCVDVKASNGDIFRYAHNKSFKVKKGQKVSAKQALAVWDSTGNSTGTHTHFEIHPGGGDAINPRDYMKAHPPADGGNMSTLATLNTKYTPGQVVTETDEYLFINTAHDVSITKGPLTAVWGDLHFTFEVLTPPSRDDSTFQVRPVIATYIDGKVTDEFSLGVQEFMYTSGKTAGFVPAPVYPLAKDRRLRFRAHTYDGASIRITEARFLGAQVK